MSGGYYSYASICQTFDQMREREGELQRLRDELAEYPDSASAVAATDAFLAKLRAAVETQDATERDLLDDAGVMCDVWQAVEWERSRDRSAEDVRASIAAFNATNTATIASAPALRLWLVKYERAKGEAIAYDNCYGVVVAAESAEAAEAIAASEERLTGNVPTKLLGTAAPGVERGVLLHDYR